MIEVTASGTIAAPVQAVFEAMTRVESLADWLVGCKEAWSESDDPYRVGGRVAHIDEVMGQSFEAHYEVDVWEPGERVVFRSVSGGPFDGTSTQTFWPEGDRTRVDVTIKGRLRGVFRFSEWPAKQVAKAQLEESLRNAKRMIEDGT
jgi:uncharacterized protein YndB with AHSA1/START domain